MGLIHKVIDPRGKHDLIYFHGDATLTQKSNGKT